MEIQYIHTKYSTYLYKYRCISGSITNHNPPEQAVMCYCKRTGQKKQNNGNYCYPIKVLLR